MISFLFPDTQGFKRRKQISSTSVVTDSTVKSMARKYNALLYKEGNIQRVWVCHSQGLGQETIPCILMQEINQAIGYLKTGSSWAADSRGDCENNMQLMP